MKCHNNHPHLLAPFGVEQYLTVFLGILGMQSRASHIKMGNSYRDAAHFLCQLASRLQPPTPSSSSHRHLVGWSGNAHLYWAALYCRRVKLSLIPYGGVVQVWAAVTFIMGGADKCIRPPSSRPLASNRA